MHTFPKSEEIGVGDRMMITLIVGEWHPDHRTSMPFEYLGFQVASIVSVLLHEVAQRM